MTRYLAARLGQTLIVVLGVTTALFLLLRAVPGDPATVIAGPDATPEAIAVIRDQYHLDEPLYQQFVLWLSSVLSGDLGTSISYQVPVATLVGQAVLPTVQLLVAAMVVGVALGLLLGVLAATRRRTPLDMLIGGLTAGMLSVPDLWAGLLLILAFAVHLAWFPSGGWTNLLVDPVGGLESLALPAITLALGIAAVQARFVRTAMIEALTGDYVRTARAKGAGERTVVWRHALRNALLPVVTITGIQVGSLLGGVVVIENVFVMPGVGSLVANGLTSRDYPVVQGAVLVLVAAFGVVNLAVDILYSIIDPRIRR